MLLLISRPINEAFKFFLASKIKEQSFVPAPKKQYASSQSSVFLQNIYLKEAPPTQLLIFEKKRECLPVKMKFEKVSETILKGGIGPLNKNAL